MDQEKSKELFSPSSATQTPNTLSSNTPRKTKYRQTIKEVKIENERLRKKVQQLEDRLREVQNDMLNNITLEQYQQLSFKFFPENAAKFVNIQASQIQKHPKGRRYSEEFKTESLGLYFTGPKVYKQLLSKKFCMPGPQCLLKGIRGLSMNSGLENPALFNVFKLKVDCFPEENKFSVLSLDEMSIKANLYYDKNRDTIIGIIMKNVSNLR